MSGDVERERSEHELLAVRRAKLERLRAVPSSNTKGRVS